MQWAKATLSQPNLFFFNVLFLPHTDHSFFPPPDVYRNMFLFHCHRGFLQEEFPRDCSCRLQNTTMFKCQTCTDAAQNPRRCGVILVSFLFKPKKKGCFTKKKYKFLLFSDVVCVKSNFSTFAAFRLVAQPIISLFAALTALSLHVDFAATLTSNQTSSNVCHAITYSSVLGAQRVAVTGCRNTWKGSLKGFWVNLNLHLLTQGWSGNSFHTEARALSSCASIIGSALLDMGREGYFEFLCSELNHISWGTGASDGVNLRKRL